MDRGCSFSSHPNRGAVARGDYPQRAASLWITIPIHPERIHDLQDQGFCPVFRTLTLAADAVRELFSLEIDEMAFQDRPFIPTVGTGDDKRLLTITEGLEQMGQYMQLFFIPFDDDRVLPSHEKQLELMRLGLRGNQIILYQGRKDFVYDLIKVSLILEMTGWL